MAGDSIERLVREYNFRRAPKDRGTFCRAPSVSLNFDQSGNVTACCLNRRFVLGTIPNKTIDEIWQGPRIHELRDILKKPDFNHGCQACLSQLKARNFSGIHALHFDRSNASLGSDDESELFPRTMEFEISNTCNFECVMCNGFFSSSIRRNREKLEPMPQVYGDDFVEQLKPFLTHLDQAKFLGGEPFLNPLYYKIWDAIADSGRQTEVVITTNGSILNDRVKRMLERVKPTLVISCDSLDKEIYESIRLNASYEIMRSNVDYFIESARRTRRPIAFSICPMPQNWKSLRGLYDFCESNQFSLYFNTVTWPRKNSFRYLENDHLSEIIEALEGQAPAKELLGAKAHYRRTNARAYYDLLSQLKFWRSEMASV